MWSAGLKLNTSSFWSCASGSEKPRRPRGAKNNAKNRVMNRAAGTHQRRRPTLSGQIPRLTAIAGIRRADEGEAP